MGVLEMTRFLSITRFIAGNAYPLTCYLADYFHLKSLFRFNVYIYIYITFKVNLMLIQLYTYFPLLLIIDFPGRSSTMPSCFANKYRLYFKTLHIKLVTI